MNLLILGGNSEIALALAHLFAEKHGAHITLASRDTALLEKKAKDLELRYQVTARAVPFDAQDFDSHEKFYAGLDPKPDVALLAFGVLGDQEQAQNDFAQAKQILDVNYTGAASILEIIARDFEQKGRGSILGLSSPAGLRGRQSNYLYGAAKGALAIHLSGLRHRLHKAGVHVMTIFPGFTATKMTEGMDLPPRLTATPEQVARDIHKGWRKKKNVIYSRWFWRYIMLIIRFLPEFLFKRTKL